MMRTDPAQGEPIDGKRVEPEIIRTETDAELPPEYDPVAIATCINRLYVLEREWPDGAPYWVHATRIFLEDALRGRL